MSRTLPWRSGGRLASVVWRMGEASGNLKSPAGDGFACYRGAAALTTTTYSVTRLLGPLERYSRGRSTRHAISRSDSHRSDRRCGAARAVLVQRRSARRPVANPPRRRGVAAPGAGDDVREPCGAGVALAVL